MSNILATWQLVAKRSRAHWRLLAAVVIGVVLAVAIMASTVIYYDALRNLALSHSIAQQKIEDLDLLIRGEHGPTNPKEYGKVDKFVNRHIDESVAWFLRNQYHGGKSATFFLTRPGEPFLRDESKDRAFFHFLSDLESHITVIDGRLPNDIIATDGPPPEIEVAIDSTTASLFRLSVGDRLITLPYWSDVNPQATSIITGVIEPTSPSEEFWIIEQEAFLYRSSNFRFAPLFVSKKTFLEGVGAIFPRLTSTYSWLLAVDTGKISGDTASIAKFNIDTFEDELGSTLSSYRQTSVLSELLSEYERRLFFARVPIFIVLILIATVILYYVMTLSSLLVEEHRGEVSLLRSRGATSFQILIVFIMEGVMISLLAVFVGPLLASWAISTLGLTPAFSDLSGGGFLSASISKGAFYMGLLGGGLGFLSLIIPAIQASKIEVVHHKQHLSRPTTSPFFQRYYLDVMLILIVILLFRQLSQQGSVLATELFGRVVVNQLLLALPALILLATAMVLLRLFPIVMKLTSHILSSRLPAGLALGLWQLSRNPTHYARLSLLLILTAGLGIFAASFGGTLERSFTERAFYSTGSDVRATGIVMSNRDSAASFRESYESIGGISNASQVYRGNGLVLSGFSSDDYTILAMERATFPSIAWFRSDFAGKPVEELIQSLPSIKPPEGIELPEDSRAIGVWVRPDKPYPDVVLQARVYDSNGRYFTFHLGDLGFTEWRLLNTSLTRRSRGQTLTFQPKPPLYLASLFVIKFDGENDLLAGSVILDDLQVRLFNDETRIVEDFESIENWNILKTTPRAASDALKLSSSGGHDGSKAGVFLWSGGSPFQSRGIYMGASLSPIPALASNSFIKETGHGLGETLEVSVSGNRVPVTLLSSVEYFPTLDPDRQSFLITDLESLIGYVNLSAAFSDIQPNELWISTDTTGAKRADVIKAIDQGSFYTSNILDREEEMKKSRLDPLVSAGWKALLFVAFAAVLLLSTIGYLVHAYISFRNRELEFALLRTMGLSLRQLISLIWLEHILIIGVGMALGTWMGSRLGTTIMPFLGNAEDGTKVLPPYIAEVNWTALAITYSIIVLLFTCTVIGVIWFIHRLPLQRVLRLGDM